MGPEFLAKRGYYSSVSHNNLVSCVEKWQIAAGVCLYERQYRSGIRIETQVSPKTQADSTSVNPSANVTAKPFPAFVEKKS
jgi:hypothetical protein